MSFEENYNFALQSEGAGAKAKEILTSLFEGTGVELLNVDSTGSTTTISCEVEYDFQYNGVFHVGKLSLREFDLGVSFHQANRDDESTGLLNFSSTLLYNELEKLNYDLKTYHIK